MASFKGTYESTIDEKRRLKLPKKLREAVSLSSDGNFIIGPGYDGCIFMFSPDEWEKREEKLKNLKVDVREHRFLERAFAPVAEDTKIDRVGRITISQRLLEHAQIKKEVLILGVLSRVELWAPEVYQKYQEEHKDSYEEVAERILGV